MKKDAIHNKINLQVLANITDEDRHNARFLLKKGHYVRVTGAECGDSDELNKIFTDWFIEEYGDQGELVQDKDTGRTYCHLRWDLSW